jgi:hypothetical protein
MNNISNDVIVFKEICTLLTEASLSVKESEIEVSDYKKEFNSLFDKVVLLALETPYGKRVMDITLEEVAYIFSITRERVRQIEMSVIGNRSNNKLHTKGKLHNPANASVVSLIQYIRT